MSDQDRLARMRALRETLAAAADGRGIWVALIERFPPASLIATPDDVRAALDLAHEIGYGDGESSANADFHEDNPAAVERAREILRDELAEVDRLRDLLGRLEWAVNCYDDPRCPVCGAYKHGQPPGRHDPGCELAAELHPGTPNDPPQLPKE
jgi:hypothetical protein